MAPRARLRAALAALTLLASPLGAAAGDKLDLAIGKALFDRAWVQAPASTKGDDGLGPLYDARSCASCHPRDGRAAMVVNGKGELEGRGAVLVLGQPGGAGDPVYGRRLQIDAIPGLRPEGILAVQWEKLPDGRLRPVPAPTDLGYGPLAAATGMSLRVAPDLRGRGLLEQVPDAAILAIAAEQARGTDGVKGLARRIVLADGTTAIGRYGWKANQPTVEAQSSEAFFLDLGMSTPLHPEPWGDCTEAQPACRNAPHGIEAEGQLEISSAVLDRVVAYVAALPVPAAERPPQGAAYDSKGSALFAATGCATCHRPSLPTKDGGRAPLFTDLLLHDMGPGLADTLPDPGATPAQWRTAPLAGVSEALARKTGLLHDGRAVGVAEAIAWHDGEARSAADRFKALSAAQKAALIAYVSRL
ncbi:di-heme oxidoredictase family protein [Aquabacter sp. P-9]|uniref:di-heme oxidoredictase family protein n=1 Tax=Aquabacter sediminis TaxID=3029197 RepID=UPI00237D905F|nr:di-heme oxidoredictase family protein [Aquabacter sp. P-9]MDE1569832.1 di-heme oxidoredictase family protein [Aquabacter sp. P-9]